MSSRRRSFNAVHQISSVLTVARYEASDEVVPVADRHVHPAVAVLLVGRLFAHVVPVVGRLSVEGNALAGKPIT